MGLKKFGSGFGRLVGGLAMITGVEATADTNHGPEQAPETNPALEQVAETYQGVEDCGVYLREVIEESRAAGNPISRTEGSHILADCRNAQLQATLAEQEATLAEQEATLAEQEATLAADSEQLAARGLKIEGDQLFDLDGRLLGNFIHEEGQPIRLDLTPWEEINEELGREYAQRLAEFETFLMRSLSEEPQ